MEWPGFCDGLMRMLQAAIFFDRPLYDDKNRVGACCMSWHIAVMSDYERIARVIHCMDVNRQDQPGLNALATFAGLSPPCFYRLLSRWAGITPKDFVQALTVERAKLLLKEGDRVLNPSIESGLSGSGRLQDLCVSLEAASPGEVKSGGAGWRIRAGFAESPFGACLIAEGPRGICHLSFVEGGGAATGWGQLLAVWPCAEFVRSDKRAGEWCERFFSVERMSPGPGGRSFFRPLTLFVKGTEFQVKVWRALLQVPEAKLVSYGKLAQLVGSPNASRAVGAAVGNNPIGYLIPCHRVIRETGAIGGYAWGVDRKRAMQVYESSLSAE